MPPDQDMRNHCRGGPEEEGAPPSATGFLPNPPREIVTGDEAPQRLVLQFAASEHLLDLQRCELSMRLLAPWLTRLTQRIAVSMKTPGRAAFDSWPGTEPPTPSSDGDPQQVGGAHGGFFRALMAPLMDLGGRCKAPKLPGPPARPQTSSWMAPLRAIAGPDAGPGLGPDDPCWDISVLARIWQSPWWLQRMFLPALRAAALHKDRHFPDEGQVLPSLQSAAAALQSTWSALVAIPWTDICQEQLREGTSAASKVAEVLQALDGMYEEADEARSTEGSIADPCSWVNLCRLASPYPGGNVMLEGVALHHLLLSAAILEIEGQLVPHVIEQVAAGCLPPPKGEDTTVLRDLTSLVAYLSGISETRPGSSKQYNTTPLRALKRNLPFQGSASSSLSALQLLHGIRQRLLLPFPTIPDPQEISTAESLRAIQLLFASFASNPRCAASAAEVGEWAVRLEASPSRCSAQVTTVTRNVDGSGPLDHLRLILPPEAENPAPISKAAQRLGSSQVATAVPMMVPLRSRDNEERFPGGFFGAVLSTLNRGGQKKFHAVDGSESQGLQHQETKGERTSGRELATPEESLAPKAPPHPKQAVERVTTNSKRKVDTSMVAAAAVAFHTKDSPSVGSSHWLYEQAVSKWRDGSLARARFFFQEALEACQPQPSRKRGEEDVDAGKGVAAAARAGLVAVLASMGDIRAASSHLNALQAEQHNGHLPSAEARAALASRCHLDGNLEAAQAHYESALTSMVSILGRGHHTTLRIRCGLAGVQARLGDFEAAWQGYRRGASGMEAVLGASHPDVLAAKCSLAGLLQDAGEQAAAGQAFRELLPQMEAALGPDNPSTMAVRGNAAAGLWLAGDLEAALVLYREALVRDRRILGNNHPDTLTDASNMAGVLGDLGRHYEAVQIYQEVLMTQERLLGSWHPSTCITRANLTHQCEQNDRELPFMSRNPEWGKYDSALNASLPRTQPWISQVVRKEAKPAVSPIKARPWDVPMPQAHGLHSAPTVSSDTTMQYSRRDFSLDLPLPVEDALVSPSTKRSPQRLKPFHSVPLETHIGSRSRRQENLTSMVWKTRWKLP